uniref:AXIN1 up-regulated 1, isoform A n=1 Tax=Drosophila melanogaster TaxID=7227 RepID=Q9U4G5_DROME|eukprot:NP_001259928.1 AXIN1 up-regulated 1, isoform C [Drosophila melanogaster]
MFSPIKKIFTYIQKNASGSNMFSPSGNKAAGQREGTTSLTAHDEGERKDQRHLDHKDNQSEPEERQHQLQIFPHLDDDDDDIERQIKTSIIDASKVHAAKAKALASLPMPLEQLDDELADFAHGPADTELEEQFLELENYPNNEIIVLGDADLNSSIASDAVSEDPLAIDNILDSASVTTNEEVDTSGELLWLKLNNETEMATRSAEVVSNNQASLEPAQPAKPKEDELRDGGSDSGLGSETSALLKDQAEKEAEPEIQKKVETKPIRSNLKRRLEDSESDAIDLVPDMSAPPVAPQKRTKRSINFDEVKVFYFPRQQGFSCVPTAGGCTLGMGARHVGFKTMTLAEHAAELRRAHRSQNQELQPRGSSSDDSEESEEDYLSEGSGSDAEDGSNGFLQPVTPKQRRALLKAAGVRKIDASEKSECRDIRNSREVCGCSCREFCDPETCACSQAGIKCQVDRAMFPCGCTREACGNTVGRVEFNPTRVRTHYIHTVMRLDLEQRQGSVQGVQGGHLQPQQQQPSQQTIGYSPVGTAGSTSAYFLQTQSNYSSGYASPAYTPESSVSYYQQQVQQPGVPTAGQLIPQQQQAQSQSYAGYAQLDSLDSGLFASGSNATPSYGELYQSLSYGSTQITSYTAAYQQHSASPAVAVAPGAPSSCAYSSCAVPSVPPYGNATTTASSNVPYQTTAVSMTAASTSASPSRLVGNPVGSATASPATVSSSPATASGNEFISLSTPIASSSRLSQINDLLQHNRNTTAALVAVSEGLSGGRTSSSASTIDSIDTPPIVDDGQQRGCMSFEALPPPLVNPAPIVAVVENKLPPMALPAPHAPPSAPQPRQPLEQHHPATSESS